MKKMNVMVEKMVEALMNEGLNAELIEGDSEITTIYVNGISINLYSEIGVAALVNSDGDTVKVYKKLVSLAKAVAKF